MFQVKISAALFVVVLALMGFAYVSLTSDVGESILAQEDAQLTLAGRSVADTRRSAHASLATFGQELSATPAVSDELARLQQMALDEGDLAPLNNQVNRARLFDTLVDWKENVGSRMLEKYGRLKTDEPAKLHEELTKRGDRDWWGAQPDLVLAFVTTPLASRVAHVLVVHAEEGQEIASALDHAQNYDIFSDPEEGVRPVTKAGFIAWTIHEYYVVATPVFDGDKAVGTVVVGYQLDSGFAERLGSVGGEHAPLAVFSGKRFYAASRMGAKDDLPGAVFHPLVGSDALEIDHDTEVAFADLDDDKTYHAELDGAELLIQRHVWIPGEDGEGSVGYVVASDYSEATASLDSLKFRIPLVGALILLVGLAGIFLITRNFLKPLEDIAVGIQEILAGNRDYLFRARSGNPLHGELSNSLNQLTAYLQGKAAPGEAETGWDEMMVDLEPERPSIYGMQAISPVKNDAEKAQLQALYDEYMTARQDHGQHVDMDFDRFCRRIKRNEASLVEKHGATSVEFSVAVSDGKVVLKPSLTFE